MKALIIDDEAMPAKYLATLLKRNFSEITEVTVALGAREGIEKLNAQVFDVLFLDIEMPQMTGFELLEEVDLSNKTSIIFTTAYENYALEAFKVSAIDYLVKPVSELDLHKALRKIKANIPAAEKPNLISVFCDNEHVILNEDEIIRLEADGSYTKIVTENGTLLSSKNLKYSSLKLNESHFYRCHNSHIINISKIEKIGKGKGTYLILKNKEMIPVSGSKIEGLLKITGV